MNLSLDRERAPTTIVTVISILLLLASLGLILWPAKTDNERTQYESNLKRRMTPPDWLQRRVMRHRRSSRAKPGPA